MINLYLRTDTNENLEDIKTTLHNVLNINQKKLDEIQPGDFSYVSKRILIKKYLNLNQIYKIENELKRFQSLELVVDYLRIYPYGEVGAHKIGYLTTNDKKDLIYGSFLSTRTGVTGLEKKFNDQLQGKLGTRYLLVNSSGREVKKIESDFKQISVKTKKGEPLDLTIDIELEKETTAMAEQKLPKLTTGVRFPSPAPISGGRRAGQPTLP